MNGLPSQVIKSFFRKRFAFSACVSILFLLFAWYWIYEYCATRPMREIQSISLKAVYAMPREITCPISFCGTKSPMDHFNARSIQLRDQIPGALCGYLQYDLSRKDIILKIVWFLPTFRGGQFEYYYEIASAEAKRNLLNFIAVHEEDLQNQSLQEAMLKMLYHHKTELAKLGDGDPYVGLERAGIPDWIKAGKDPEAEWQKKYPSETP